MASGPPDFGSCSKFELRALCDRLPSDDPEAVEACVAFLEAETVGLWHGRARAVIGRRQRAVLEPPAQRDRVARAVLGRLVRGRFSEGFRDQLRLVLRVAPERAFDAARGCPPGAPPHARRFAAWVLAHEPPRHAEPVAAPDAGRGTG